MHDPLLRSCLSLNFYSQFGCLSARLFYLELHKIFSKAPGGSYTKPPVSLEGQLIWREFFYTCSAFTPNFDKMVGNPICRQIPWGEGPIYEARFMVRTNGLQIKLMSCQNKGCVLDGEACRPGRKQGRAFLG
jgi:cryptochrome